MDKKYWEDVQSRMTSLKQLDTAYANSSINVLADYADTARTIASVMQGTTMKRLGKRIRPLQENVKGDANADDDGKGGQRHGRRHRGQP
jgi:hypothetical protein